MDMVKKNLPTILLIVIFIIFAGGVLLSQYLPNLTNNNSEAGTGTTFADPINYVFSLPKDAMLSLDADSTKVVHQVGDEIKIDLFLDTATHDILGMDAIINYPEDLLEITSIDTLDTFDNYPIALAENGQIKISGLKEIDKFVNGTFKIATITVKTIAAGEANLEFDFEPMSSTDSNVVTTDFSVDLLGFANGLTLTIN